MAGEVTRTGSYPAVTIERPSPPPPPERATSEWYAWVEKRMAAHDRDVARALGLSEHVEAQIGRPPVPALKDAGAGMWLVLADVRADCTAILAKLDAADRASEKRGGWAARIGWRALETLIPIAIVALLAWLGGWHR